MKYDFETQLDRLGKDAIAIDLPVAIAQGKASGQGFILDAKLKDGFDVIPMWVADMNFITCPTIPEALIERAKHPAYGYFSPSDEYYNAILRWHEKRNGVKGLTKDCIGYENGVLGGVIGALRVLAEQGGKVILQSPTYIGFTHCMEDNGYDMVLNQMYLDAQGIWRIDYDLLEKQVVENKIHAAVFCSPHNPTGRVWEKEEVERVMEIYRKHDVYVVSDEIWSDLILTGYRHIPTQSVSEDAKMRTVALYAPSKTFNLAGLIGSYHIIYNQYLRERIDRCERNACYNSMNVLSMHALIGAYKREGYEWVGELCEVLTKNANFACDFIGEHFEGVTVSRPQGTYMLFLDCSEWCKAHGKTLEELQRQGLSYGVIWQDGVPFHGPCHIRLNLALPYQRVVEAFERLDRYVFNGKW